VFQHAQLYIVEYKKYQATHTNHVRVPKYGVHKSLAYYHAMAIVLIANRLHMVANYGPYFEHCSHLYPQLRYLCYMCNYHPTGMPFIEYVNGDNTDHTLPSFEQYIRNLSGKDFAGLTNSSSDDEEFCRTVLTHVKEMSASRWKQSDLSWTLSEQIEAV
jgi:hypothetical protein